MTTIDLDVTVDAAFAAHGVRVELGCLRAKVGDLTAPTDLTAALERATEDARDRAAAGTANVPQIARTRRAYKACGKDPSRYRPASEALLRRVLKGEPAPRVNAVVDINTLLSLQTGLACGVYDARQLHPPLRLRLGTSDDTYEGIGRGVLNVEHLPLLEDTAGPFGSPTSDSTRTAVNATTDDVLLVIYGFDDDVDEPLDIAMQAFTAHLAATDLRSAVIDR